MTPPAASWGRYFEQLAHLARAKLRVAPRGPADGEDVALSALDSFFAGAAAGEFSRLGGRDDLWRLLVTITARKAANQLRHEHQRKRGGGRVLDVEIAGRLGTNVRAVERKLAAIRKRWQEDEERP